MADAAVGDPSGTGSSGTGSSGTGSPAGALLARSPVPPRGPVGVLAGWEVSLRRSAAPLRLADWTALAKVAVRAGPATAAARALRVPHGRAAADGARLVVGSGPDEWLLLGPPGTADALVGSCPGAGVDELVTVVDVTSARALLRLTGETAAAALAKVCAIDLHDSRCPPGSAFTTSVAGVVTGVVRDDLAGGRSYLLHCDRSYGQFLFEALLDAGGEMGIDVDGLRVDGLRVDGLRVDGLRVDGLRVDDRRPAHPDRTGTPDEGDPR